MPSAESASYDVAIANEQGALSIDRERLEEIVRMTLQAEGAAAATISVAIVDDPTMHSLNRAHLDHDYPTDVLSFLLECSAGEEAPDGDDPRSGFAGFGKCLDGEVIISADTAIRESAAYGWQPQDELALYLVHGLLHLCGYDDLEDDAQTAMRSREREILQFWGLSPHYQD
jgi:probable rRNA maturation factor